MRINIDKLRFKKDFDRIRILHWVHFLLILLITFIEVKYHSIFSTFIRIFIILIFYKLFFQTVRNLFYTYFSFLFVVYVYLAIGLIQALFIYHNRTLVDLNLLTMIILSVECYMLSSPIYFPRVNWWIYDFRYRHDLPITITVGEGNNEIEGRLTDLRRYAGCVLLFEDLEIGSVLHINTSDIAVPLTAEVMSKHVYSMERGLSYGVKFNFESPKEKKRFDYFSRYFKKNGRLKLSSNFQ